MAFGVNYDPTFFNQAAQTLQQSAANAMPSEQMRDTAASRIRARLASAQQGNERQLADQAASRGRGLSGNYQQNLGQSRAQAQGALASGLADNEANYYDRLQKGSEILNSIGQSQSALGAQSNAANTAVGTLAKGEMDSQTDLLKAQNDFTLGTRRNDIDSAYYTGKNANDAAATEEAAQRRRAETTIEALKTFGQFGNVGGQNNYAGFSSGLADLLRQAGINIDIPAGPTGSGVGGGTPGTGAIGTGGGTGTGGGAGTGGRAPVDGGAPGAGAPSPNGKPPLTAPKGGWKQGSKITAAMAAASDGSLPPLPSGLYWKKMVRKDGRTTDWVATRL